MELREAVRFVKGAAIKHGQMLLSPGRITVHGENLTVSCPAAINLTARPHADVFCKAIEQCGAKQIEMTQTASGKVTIAAQGLRVHVPIHVDAFDFPSPEGPPIRVESPILETLACVADFITDESAATASANPWATGVKFADGSAFATNNVAICAGWLGLHLPYVVTVPGAAIKEWIRIGVEPSAILCDKKSITLGYANGAWLRSSLLAHDWPKIAGQLLETLPGLQSVARPPEGFFAAVKTLEPFADDQGAVYIGPGRIRTSAEGSEGAEVEIATMGHAKFHARALRLVGQHATRFDWSAYPAACPWYNEAGTIGGLVIGMR